MTASSSPFYLVSGFHRSGTSLLANTLRENGTDMGENLMGASFANRQGHVEDMPLVELHDQMLAANGQDWRCTATSQLAVPDFLASRLADYIATRTSATSHPIGAKDPRAVHFCDTWQRVSQQTVKAIFVYRDWRYSVSSLLKRHSRELLHYATPMQQREVDFSFWREPELAARMWLSSSEAMLYWLKHHPDNTLVLPLSALTQQHSSLFSCAQQKGFPTSLLTLTRAYDETLLQSVIPASLIEMLPAPLRQECDAMQATLNSKSGVISNNESVALSPAHSLSNSACHHSSGFASAITTTINISGVTVTEALDILHTLPADKRSAFPWQALMARPLEEPKSWENIYKAALEHQQFQVAETAIVRALNLQPKPWRMMYLGDLYLAQKQLSLASQCYLKARKMAPANATFVARLADIATEQGEFDKARSLLDEAKHMDATKPAIRSAESRLTAAAAPEQLNATVRPTGHPYEMPRITNYMDVVASLTQHPENGQVLDDYFVRYQFIRRNNREWLLSALRELPAAPAQCLQDYILSHLNRYWPTTALATELYEKSLPTPTKHSGLDEKSISLNANIGIHLHVYYVHLIPQMLAFMRALPAPFRLVVTCMADDKDTVQAMLPADTEVIAVANRGRDIAPWLMQAAPRLAQCELVLKLHTKATPHAPQLTGWRLQLLWALLGDTAHTHKVLTGFRDSPDTGIMLPPYHPAIVKDIHWGSNLPQVKALADKLDILLPDSIDTFPAGSMFWYRPDAIRAITQLPWQLEDFPEESGQTDGTLMHAIERLLCLCADKARMPSQFISML